MRNSSNKQMKTSSVRWNSERKALTIRALRNSQDNILSIALPSNHRHTEVDSILRGVHFFSRLEDLSLAFAHEYDVGIKPLLKFEENVQRFLMSY